MKHEVPFPLVVHPTDILGAGSSHRRELVSKNFPTMYDNYAFRMSVAKEALRGRYRLAFAGNLQISSSA